MEELHAFLRDLLSSITEGYDASAASASAKDSKVYAPGATKEKCIL